jgi:SAM-dependent methyltransferase
MKTMGAVACGFCGSSRARAIKTTSRSKLLDQYRHMHGLTFPDQVLASSFAFSRITSKRCVRCGTIAYDPLIAGDSSYYEFLSGNLSWYHSTKRWEYPLAADMLARENPRLFLEVGCGAGHFLRLARSRGYEGHGSELNERHIEALRAEGFSIVSDLHNLPTYDAVFMFQVLEHLPDPHAVLTSLLPRVRPGGILVLSTPVTPSCTAVALPPFALPPHHQWLPTLQGFELLADRLGVACERLLCDPPDYDQLIYAIRKWCGYLPYSRRFARYWSLVGRIALKGGTLMRCGWARVGHTGMAVFRKPATSH